MSWEIDRRPILITGGAGFIGSNLADRLAGEDHHILIFDSLSRDGADRNIAWLKERHGNRIESIVGDVRNENEVARAVADAKAVFHLAAQVAVTSSLADPREDFDINVRGTLNLLEAARARAQPAPVIFASTNKVYGDLSDMPFECLLDRHMPKAFAARRGIGEDRPLDFQTPYGCSKGAADQYVLDYCRSYGVPAVVFRMGTTYGQRQWGGEDQGWVTHFLARALEDEPVTIYGDGRQVRDILDVADAVDAFVRALDRIARVKGRAFNLGGGPNNAVSLLQLIEEIRTLLRREVRLRFEDWRRGDQPWYVSDTRAADAALGLAAPRGWREGVARLAEWLAGECGTALHAERHLVSAIQ